ncbi:unnamed protein product, partial [marine sediment metagenome]
DVSGHLVKQSMSRARALDTSPSMNFSDEVYELT